ncbi:MAG: hypothetical protein RLY14_1753 [Planctomycetota bacterium]|jgi:hypothetical protein
MDNSHFLFQQGLQDTLYNAQEFLQAIPSASNPEPTRFAFHCDGARIEIELKPNEPTDPNDSTSDKTGDCQVASLRIYILPKYKRNTRSAVTALGYYEFTINPDSGIGANLTDLSYKFILRSQGITSAKSRRDSSDFFLRMLANATKTSHRHEWKVFPNPAIAISHQAIGSKYSVESERYMLNVIPSFHDFIDNRDLADNCFVSFKKVGDHWCIIRARIFAAKKLITWERSRGQLTQLQRSSVDYPLYDHDGNPDGWIDEIERRVSLDKSASEHYQIAAKKRDYHSLVQITFDYMMEFKNYGDLFFDKLMRRNSKVDDSVDKSIQKGEIEYSRNRLKSRSRTGSLIQLEIGNRVARASINCQDHRTSSTIAWYLKSERGFKHYDHETLVSFWRASERLNSPSQAVILQAVRTLNSLTEPSTSELTNFDDLLGDEILAIKGLTFHSASLKNPMMIVQAAQGIQLITIQQSNHHRSIKHPQNFYRMDCRLSCDNSVELTLTNKMKGGLTAFISAEDCINAGGYQEVLKTICLQLSNWRHPMRVSVHKQLEMFASGPDSWISTTSRDNSFSDPCTDLPPSHLLDLNLAYENTAFVTREICRGNTQALETIKISYVRDNTDCGWICQIEIAPNASSWFTTLLIDRLGIKQVAIHNRGQGNSCATVKFIRPPNGTKKLPKNKLQQLCSRLLKTVAFASPSSTTDEPEDIRSSLEDYLSKVFYPAADNSVE